MARLGGNTSRPPTILTYVGRPSGGAAVLDGSAASGSLEDLVQAHDPDLLVVEESLELPDGVFHGHRGIRDVLVMEDEDADDPLVAARSIYEAVATALPGIIALRQVIPEPLQHHRSAGTTISRTLRQRLGRELPSHHKRDGVKGPRPYFREQGLYSDVFEVDFSSFYPSIIVNESITPQWDTTSEFQRLAADFVGLLRQHPDGLAKSLIKRVAVAMSGFLNSGAPGSDPDCLVRIYEHGSKLLERLSTLVEGAGGTILWRQTDGLLVDGLRSERRVAATLGSALPNYSVTVDGPLDVLIFDTQSRILRNRKNEIRWKGSRGKQLRKLPAADQLINRILDRDYQSAAKVWNDLQDQEPWRRHLSRLWALLKPHDFVAVFGPKLADEVAGESNLARDPVDQVRHRNAEGRRRRRLSILHETPCLVAVKRSLHQGERIGSEPILKAVAELRIEGGNRESAAQSLVRGDDEVFRHLDGLGIIEGSSEAPLVASTHWARSAADQYSPSCRHPSLQGLCARHRCYRQSVPVTYRDTGLEPGVYVDHVRAEAERLVQPPIHGVRYVEVPCRGGKTHRLAERAHEAAVAGRKVWIVVPDHRAAHQVMAEIKARTPTDVLAVHQIGRSIGGRPNEDVCWNTSAPSCGGCSRSVLDLRLDRRRGVFDVAKLQRVAQRLEKKGTTTCPRTLSYRLAGHADIRVLTTAAYIKRCADGPDGQEADGLPDVLLVDEADHLAARLHADCQGSLPLAAARSTRHRLYSEDGASCRGMECKDCHFQFPDAPGEGGTARPVHRKELRTANEADSAASFLHDAIGELLVFQQSPRCEDDFDMANAVMSSLEVLGGLLDLLEDLDGRSPRDQLRQLQGKHAEGGEAGWVWRETQGAWTWELGKLRDYPAEIDRLCEDTGLADSLRVALQFARFVSKAALCSSELLLIPKAKTAPTQTWMPGCGLELSFVDEVRLTRLLRPLKERPSLLVSGTQGRPEIARARLGLGESVAEHRSGDTGLHTGYTLFLVPPPGTSHAVDGAVDLRNDKKLGVWMDLLAEERPELSVLVFAKTKTKAELLYRHLSGRHQVRRLDARDEVRPKEARGGLRIDVDYLRSGESRAVDRDYDLIVVHGTGLPNYSGLHTMSRWMERGVEVAVRPDELARDDASRTVAQALLRNAGKTRAVGVLIGDHLPEGLPKYLRPRAVWAPRFEKSVDPIQGFSDLVVTALDGRRLPDTVARATMTGEAQALGLPKISTLTKIMRLRDEGGVSPTGLRESLRLDFGAAMRIYRHVPERWRGRVDRKNATQSPA